MFIYAFYTFNMVAKQAFRVHIILETALLF